MRQKAALNPHFRIAKLHERLIQAGYQVGRAWVTELYRDLEGYINDLARREKRDVRNFAHLEVEIAAQALQEDALANQGVTPATSTTPYASLDEVFEAPKAPSFEELEASILDDMLKKL